MSYIIAKLSSRKLWMAIAGIGTGIYIAMGGDANDIETVSGAVTALISAMTYIIIEGKIDAAAIGGVVEDIQDALDKLTD